MKHPVSVQITYRKGEPFAAYIYLSKPGQKAVRTSSVTEDLIVDYGENDTPLGIEILSPDQVTIDEILGVFDRLGLDQIEPEELKPLRAA